MTRHPGPDDLPYLRASFVALNDLANAHGREPAGVRTAVREGRLPHPAYVLADGTPLVAPDFFALSDAAGGDDQLPSWFAQSYVRAAAGHPEADPPALAWRDYLGGRYAACLRSVSPATIVRKAVLTARIEALIEAPQEGERDWAERLRAAVDALDILERPFAAVDRADGPVSRDRLITAVRNRFRRAWGAA